MNNYIKISYTSFKKDGDDMAFIGIITDFKSRNDIQKLLLNNKFIFENNVIFIKEENIDNIKNVHFDTVVINREFKKVDELNKLLENTRNIILNIDVKFDSIDLKNVNNQRDKISVDNVNSKTKLINSSKINIISQNVITYGFNSKSNITISSVTDDDVLVCVQRNIRNNNEEIEIQEIKIENRENYSIYDLIIVISMYLMYLPIRHEIDINGIK